MKKSFLTCLLAMEAVLTVSLSRNSLLEGPPYE